MRTIRSMCGLEFALNGCGGAVGPKGHRCADGPTGPTGPAGPQGATGAQGPAGVVDYTKAIANGMTLHVS